MAYGWTARGSRWIAILALTLASHAGWAETIAWTEAARLHDGRTVDVTIEGNSTILPYYLSYQKSKVNQFKLAFRNPDTQQPVIWQGARYFSPVLLDVVQGVPYLVVYGHPTQDTTENYGCPELPYIFLRYGPDGWQPIAPDQAPAVVGSANLATQGMDGDVAGRHLTPDDIAQRIAATERETAGQMQAAIPRTVADWHALNRRNALTDRLVGDCRPPHALMQPLVLSTPTQSTAEVLESIDFVPETAYSHDDWTQRSVDTPRADACKPLFKAVEVDPYNLDLRFANDSTGAKRVPYSHQGEWDSNLQLLCDARLWFITTQGNPKTFTLTLYTQNGDLVTRVSFAAPTTDPDMVGTLLWPTLRYGPNYLYFDWAIGHADGTQWLVKRILKMRIPLP